MNHTTVQDIPLAEIHESTWNPRKHFEASKLEELAASIREKGVIEPAIVRPRAKGGVELIAGARRFRASQLAGVATLPCLTRELDDTQALEFAVVENGQREDVSAVEEARGYQALMKADKKYTVAIVAAKVGKSESYVYRRVKLLELAAPLLEALEENRLSVAHAEKLARLDRGQQLKAAGLCDYNGKPAPFRGDGVVWRASPLLDEDRQKPGLADLQPLHALESWIRNKTFFAPATETTRHFQPELAKELDQAIDATLTSALDEDENLEQDDAAALRAEMAASVVTVTTDSMARSRMGLKANAPMPLVPSKWREVKGKACEHTRVGVVVHGSESRVIKVCTAKTKCEIHFPELKRKKKAAATARKSSVGSSAGRTDSERASDQKLLAKREAEQKALAEASKYWNGLVTRIRPAVIKHLAGLKVTLSLLAFTMDNGDLYRGWDRRIKERWGITVTDATLGQALALEAIALEEADEFEDPKHQRHAFLETAKFFKFNLGTVEQKYKAELKAAAAKEKREGKK